MLYIEIANKAEYVLHYEEAEKQIWIRVGGSMSKLEGSTSGAKPLGALALEVGIQVPYISRFHPGEL